MVFWSAQVLEHCLFCMGMAKEASGKDSVLIMLRCSRWIPADLRDSATFGTIWGIPRTGPKWRIAGPCV